MEDGSIDSPWSSREGTIDYLRFADLPGVEVMDVQSVSRKWAYFHEAYAFCAVSRVEDPRDIFWRYRLQTHATGPDGVQLMEPGEFHTNLWTAPRADFRVLFVSPARLASVTRDLGWRHVAPPHLRIAQLRGGNIRRLLCELTGSLVDANDVERAELGLCRFVQALSDDGCLEGVSPPARRERGRKPLRIARELIHAEWNRHLPLSEISRGAGIPVSTLERTFQEALGTTPRQYQNHLRLMRAKELLKGNDFRISEAAARCGFSDAKYFSRLFRREFGRCPCEYQRPSGNRRNQDRSRV